MKKLTKSSLAQMAALLPELDAEDQRCILGGTAQQLSLPVIPALSLNRQQRSRQPLILML